MSIFDSLGSTGQAVTELPKATRQRAKGPDSPFLPTLQSLFDNGGAWCYQGISVVSANPDEKSVADTLTQELRSAVRQVKAPPNVPVQLKTRRILSADKQTADIYVAVGVKKDDKATDNGAVASTAKPGKDK